MTLWAPLRSIIAAASLAVLSGCAAITAVSDAATPLDVYELRAPGGIAPSGGARIGARCDCRNPHHKRGLGH